MAEETKSKRKWLIILLIILLLIIIIAGYLYYKHFQAASQLPLTNINGSNINNSVGEVNGNINGVTPFLPAFVNLSPVEQERQKKESNVLFFAMPFAERLGTYSNQGNFANLDELGPLMTETMKNWVQKIYKVELREKYADIAYFGIETKAISSKFNNLDENRAEVIISTQRSEYVNTPANPRIYYQDVLLKLISKNDSWLVDGAFWQ